MHAIFGAQNVTVFLSFFVFSKILRNLLGSSRNFIWYFNRQGFKVYFNTKFGRASCAQFRRGEVWSPGFQENPTRAKIESWESPYGICHFTISIMSNGQTDHVYGFIYIQHNQSWCCKAKLNTVDDIFLNSWTKTCIFTIENMCIMP